MKISISYPPLESNKGTPGLAQNRQFQWFSDPTFIYPVIPAYAATLLKANGYEVLWDDAVTQGLSFRQWRNRIVREKPEIIAIETKTPVVKMHWKIIKELKAESYKVNKAQKDSKWNPKIVLMGDHVSALPEESLKNSNVDYVIAGGDYDFALLNLANHLDKGAPLEGGFWFKDEKGMIQNTGPTNVSKHELNKLPLVDRELTCWRDYGYKNGNFKYTPGGYIMSARDCWWGKCSFCSWAALFPSNQFRVMEPSKALDEIGNLIKAGAKEIMEDSGSLPMGQWLEEFCRGMIERGYNKKVRIGCNMRIGSIQDIKILKLMKKSGFRFALFGVESANQETLDKINKNIRVNDIEKSLEMCQRAGLEPHATFMISYPWETRRMVQKTLKLAKQLLKKGYIGSLQATLCIPYPGTPLYDYCLTNNLLLTKDYDDFDQKQPIIKSAIAANEIMAIIRDFYKSVLFPKFIAKKIVQIRSFYDIKILIKNGMKWLAKLRDFKPTNQT